jgi:hypothetical protein
MAPRAIPGIPHAATIQAGIPPPPGTAIPRPIQSRELRTGRVTIQVLPGAAAPTNQARHGRPIPSRETLRPIARYLHQDQAAQTTGQRLQAHTGLRLQAVTGHPVLQDLPDPVTGPQLRPGLPDPATGHPVDPPDPVTGPLQDPRDPSAAVRAA